MKGDKRQREPVSGRSLRLILLLGLAFSIIAVIAAPVPNAAGADNECYLLALIKEGNGQDLDADPDNSNGCSPGKYLKDAKIKLTADPAPGWGVKQWEGTDNNDSVAPTNTATMPGEAHTVKVFYEQIPITCYELMLSHIGQGKDPTADPANSAGCEAKEYTAGQVITLTAAPDPGWRVKQWDGTDDDSSRSVTNQLTMPAADKEVRVEYEQIRSLIPLVLANWPVWTQLGDDLPNLYTATACPSDPSLRYAGGRDKSYQWQNEKWKEMSGGPANVRDFLFPNAENCDDVYAASYSTGVSIQTSDGWQPVGQELPTARSVIIRGDDVFLAAQTGLYHRLKSVANDQDWTHLFKNKDFTRLSLAGSRVYAAVFGEGVWFNDPCENPDADQCGKWIPVGKPEFTSIFDAVGSEEGKPPEWAVMATARGIYYWDNEIEEWKQPASLANAPSGNVFTLTQDGDRIFAGVQNGGVWESFDHGKTWSKLGYLPSYTIIDLVFVPGHGLYATTPINGVWYWPSN